MVLRLFLILLSEFFLTSVNQLYTKLSQESMPLGIFSPEGIDRGYLMHTLLCRPVSPLTIVIAVCLV